MTNLRKIFGIAQTDLRRLAHDRTAAFFMIALPVLIILIIGSAIGGINRLALGVASEDAGPFAADLRGLLAQAPEVRIVAFSTPDALSAAIRHQEVVAGVVIPSDFGAAVGRGDAARVRFVAGPNTLSLSLRSPVNAAVDAENGRIQAARVAAGSSHVPFDVAWRSVKTAAAAGPSVGVTVSTATRGAPIPQGFAYTAPSNLVIFVFITSLAASGALVQSRRLGITRRMLASPTPRSVVLLGQIAGRLAIAVFESVFLLAVGAGLFGVHWGDPLAAGLLVAAFVVVSTGAAMLIGTVARTEEVSASLGPPIGIALGMLGGCMWPLAIVPPVLRTIGHLTPHAWAMDAFIVLIARDGHVDSIAPNLVVLAAFGAALVPISAWRLRRAV